MKKNIVKVLAACAAFFCLGTALYAKTLKPAKVDLKSVSKLIEKKYSPKIDKEDARIAIKSKGTSFVKLNDTKMVVTVSSKWTLKDGVSETEAAVIANKINAGYPLVQAAYRDATRDEGAQFVLEASLPYVGGLDSENLNCVIEAYVKAAEKLEELVK